MRWLPIAVALLAVTVFAQTYRHDGSVLLPNPELTPGLARTQSRKEICGTTTGQFRHTDEATKKKVCAEYGIAKGCPGTGYEIDHLISLEAGGADDIRNLWPQPAPQFHWKDRLEDREHALICSGKVSVVQAQSELAHDWPEAYAKRIGGLP